MGAGIDCKETEETFWNDGIVLYPLVWVVVTWVFTFIKTHRTVHLMSMHFIVCKLHLKTDLKKKQQERKIHNHISCSNSELFMQTREDFNFKKCTFTEVIISWFTLLCKSQLLNFRNSASQELKYCQLETGHGRSLYNTLQIRAPSLLPESWFTSTPLDLWFTLK